ncbi:MAG: hypothetical protein AKCLJLPJ_00374 [Fimbriimonadales bacterium]|nr:hypothetical protein [Fimbriimonadales bacterium]
MVAHGVGRAELLGDLFVRLFRIGLGEKLMAGNGPTSLTLAQYEALRFIARHPHSTVGEMAEGMRTAYPSATNMVTRLHKKGLIKKVGVRSDRRLVKVVLSDTGKQVLDDLNSTRTNLLGEALAEMSDEEQVGFLQSLDRFIRAASDAGLVEGGEVCVRCGSDGQCGCPLLRVGALEECK